MKKLAPEHYQGVATTGERFELVRHHCWEIRMGASREYHGPHETKASAADTAEMIAGRTRSGLIGAAK